MNMANRSPPIKEDDRLATPTSLEASELVLFYNFGFGFKVANGQTGFAPNEELDFIGHRRILHQEDLGVLAALA